MRRGWQFTPSAGAVYKAEGTQGERMPRQRRMGMIEPNRET